ncbi:hypothetical protein STIUS_v1c03660 [Spiroplasma sp. TIUS-1]|uniref:hypothetical protein n=1 Tax=Spiroplasma sp. TIUS-1 TaxID=216963 RepID=UPI0013987253|nr:hypothetical protein [Spiroplasma sp. TIUS-1]QHX35920.1 hypothetical protein STIUS_v1c03660 [Spiroplasma sp. TIUS-1]
MKKLLTILAISTITIGPSVTLVSCFNDTKPKFFYFDEKDPIGSINNAVENRTLKLSAGDFGYYDNGEFQTFVDENTSPIVYEISNSFTKVEDIQASRKWLTNHLPDLSTEKITPGEVFSVKFVDDSEEKKETFVKFDVQQGYSFNWLKNSDKKETFFLGSTNTDFSSENNKDSIKVLTYLSNAFNKYKGDNSESGKVLKESAAMQIYSSLILQTISKVKNQSESGWKLFNQLNSSNVIFNESTDKEKMRFFTKGNPSSIADFITLVTEEIPGNKIKVVEFIGNLLEKLEQDQGKNGVIIYTNFFDFKLDEENGWYKFKVTKE